MNAKTNEPRLGISFVSFGIGIYLLVLESIRLINSFATRFYEVQLASTIYVGGCLVCALLIAIGLILSAKRIPGLLLGIVSFPILGVTLFYGAYFVPILQHERYQASDWLLVCAICFVGISFIGWGWFNVTKRK